MAGRGPAPKDPAKRVRRHKDPVPTRTVNLVRAEQPELPAGFSWPDQTLAWWQQWAESPISDDFTSLDWGFLLDTAVLHASYWSGDLSVAGELRTRVAKFGATPEDRARLRIQYADSDEEPRPGAVKATSAEQRYGNLRVVVGQ